jgi:hypothetical protein
MRRGQLFDGNINQAKVEGKEKKELKKKIQNDTEASREHFHFIIRDYRQRPRRQSISISIVRDYRQRP